MPTFPKPPWGNPGPGGSPAFPAPEPPKPMVPQAPKKVIEDQDRLPIAEKGPSKSPSEKPPAKRNQ
jgi:hypothetical protein